MRSPMLIRWLPLLAVAGLVLSGCDRSSEHEQASGKPWVLTARLEVAPDVTWSLTGTVRARHEIPLAFRLGGEIAQRTVDAGARVAAGQTLFTLDASDVQQQQAAARARASGAEAAWENAERERRRLAAMVERKLVSRQQYDQAATAARAAREELAAARAAHEQARNAVAYAALRAPAAGIVLDVQGQVGQVVAAGQPLATLGQDGSREAEVDVPENRRETLPRQALAIPFGSERPIRAELRELQGAVDPVSRTWRARYRLLDAPANLALGSTLTLRFAAADSSPATAPALRLRVPLAAVLERGNGATLWQVVDGQVQPVAVKLLGMRGEFAEIATTLPPGTEVVALGVNRLNPGQAVRVRAQ